MFSLKLINIIRLDYLCQITSKSDYFGLFLFYKNQYIISLNNDWHIFQRGVNKMKWVPEYNTGIDVIDDQHKRILDYINEINSMVGNTDHEKIKNILNHIIDYTQSHFTFEESLQEEADYKYRVPHKRVHDLFIKRIESYRDRFEMGQAIESELHEVLSKWLINHIQHDDADYVGAVKENMIGIIKQKEQKKGKNWFARFFS